MWESVPNTAEFRAFMQTPSFLNLPALLPPPGIVPNYEDPENLKAPGLAATQLLVATVVVCLRFCVKTYVVRKTLIEDYFIYASAVAFGLFNVLVFKVEALPLGVHQYDLKIGQALQHAKLLFIGIGLYAIVMTLVKVAVTLQIRRILLPYRCTTALSGQDQKLRWCLDLTLATNVLYYVVAFVFHWASCRPISRAWDPRVEGVCVANETVFYIISGALNTASDVVLIVASQTLVWRLNLDTRRKCELSVMFGLLCLVLVASAIRLGYTVAFYRSDDKTYYGALMGKWAEPEITLSIVAACLPVLPSFIRRIRTSEQCSFSHWTRKCGLSFVHKPTGTTASTGRQQPGPFFRIRSPTKGEAQHEMHALSRPSDVRGLTQKPWYLAESWNIDGSDRISQQIVLCWEDDGLIVRPKQAAASRSRNSRANPD